MFILKIVPVVAPDVIPAEIFVVIDPLAVMLVTSVQVPATLNVVESGPVVAALV